MKRLFITVLLFLSLGSRAFGQAPIAVCTHDNSGPGNTASCPLPGLGPNELLVVGQWAFNNIATMSPVSDTFGLTWSTAQTGNCEANGFRGGGGFDWLTYAWAYTGAHSGTDTITVAAQGASNSSALVAAAYNTGVSSGGPGSGGSGFNSCNGGTTATAMLVSSGTFTAMSSNSLVIGFGEQVGAVPSAGPGFTLVLMGSVVAGLSPWLPFEQKTGSGSGLQSTMQQAGSGGFWLMVGASFPTRLGGMRHHISIY